MPPLRPRIALRTEDARPGRGEDRVAAVMLDSRVLLALVDGAGGVGRGAAAADAVCQALQACSVLPDDWCAWLRARDLELARIGGQAAAVVLDVREDGYVSGASVGDCEARVFIDGREVQALTGAQQRKPLLGTGAAEPVSFEAQVEGSIIVASDGLWKYAPEARIAEAAAQTPPEQAVEALLAAVRLPSGAPQDDVAVIVCECTR